MFKDNSKVITAKHKITEASTFFEHSKIIFYWFLLSKLFFNKRWFHHLFSFQIQHNWWLKNKKKQKKRKQKKKEKQKAKKILETLPHLRSSSSESTGTYHSGPLLALLNL
jgi:hypothetical protein